MGEREILFSVTAKDCRFDFYRGSGKGGQKRNKTSSACRCTHIASGAVGQSEDSRSQHENKATAFKRMAETKEFRAWHKLEVARTTGLEMQINDRVDAAMKSGNLRIENKENGLWVAE